MAVTLQISGFNLTGNAVKLQTVADGSTIHIERLPDGSSFIYVAPPAERSGMVDCAGADTKSVGRLQTGQRAATGAVSGHGKVSEDGQTANSGPAQPRSIHDILNEAVLKDFALRQRAPAAEGETTATTKQSAQDQLRHALTKGATIILVERDALHPGS